MDLIDKKIKKKVKNQKKEQRKIELEFFIDDKKIKKITILYKNMSEKIAKFCKNKTKKPNIVIANGVSIKISSLMRNYKTKEEKKEERKLFIKEFKMKQMRFNF